MALFMLAATVFNIVVTVICIAVLMLLYTVLVIPHIPDKASIIGVLLLFLVSFILSFIIYQKTLKLYLKKYPVSKDK